MRRPFFLSSVSPSPAPRRRICAEIASGLIRSRGHTNVSILPWPGEDVYSETRARDGRACRRRQLCSSSSRAMPRQHWSYRPQQPIDDSPSQYKGIRIGTHTVSYSLTTGETRLRGFWAAAGFAAGNGPNNNPEYGRIRISYAGAPNFQFHSQRVFSGRSAQSRLGAQLYLD